MAFFELVQERYSVREYKPDSVEDDKLQQVHFALYVPRLFRVFQHSWLAYI
jgi:nitroreductase